MRHKNMCLSLLLVISFTLCDVICAVDVIDITTPMGTIGGIKETITFPDSTTANVTSFRGIPYAKAPVGTLRFQQPVALTLLDEYLMADKESAACPQPSVENDHLSGHSDMDEDCLKLNVFVPQGGESRGEDRLPVMVWFHPGAFQRGRTSTFDGRTLAGFGDVVVVTVNYRVGPLGFLSTEDSIAPGNAGLWDQHTALKWIHDNIEAFGGDPDRVTAFGHAAGAASVVYQLLFPGNKGLIRRAIVQSGSAISPWAFQTGSARSYAERLAVGVGCTVEGSDTERSISIIDCLQTKPYAEIINNSNAGSLEETLFRPVWIPTADNDFISKKPAKVLLSQPDPYDLEVLEPFQSVDMLVGFSDSDGVAMLSASVEAFLISRTGLNLSDYSLTTDTLREHYLPQIVKDRFGFSSRSAEDAIQMVYGDHGNNKDCGQTSDTNTDALERALFRARSNASAFVLKELLDLTSDYGFIMPALITADNHAAHQSCSQLFPSSSYCNNPNTENGHNPDTENNRTKAAYVYIFSYQNSSTSHNDWLEGAAYGYEMPIVFGFPDSMSDRFNFTEANADKMWPFARSVMTYWTNFAKSGNPNKPVPVPVSWPEYNIHSKEVIGLQPAMTSDTVVTSDPYPQRSRLWKEYLPRIAAMEMNQCYKDPVEVSSGHPSVTINSSTIIGTQTEIDGRRLRMFLGVPFAEPPVGDFRFRKPVPFHSLPPVLNATSYKPPCMSVYPSPDQSEDCLYLNIFVPAPRAQALPSPLSVMVWIHGGGFITGSAKSPDGTVLASQHDVIVVTVDYRLGPFGFLSTMDEASPGNMGLWDQYEALKWVKINIVHFGGDPNSITVFGESAGGKSVSFLATSPHSGPLFQRAIMQSGTIYCPTSLLWKPVETAVLLGRAMDCDVSSHGALVDCLRYKPAEELGRVSDTIWDDDPVRKIIDFGWSPVEDGDFVPKLYNQDGSLTSISHFHGSVMLGINNNEGAVIRGWRVPVAKNLDENIDEKIHDRQFFTNTFMKAVLAQMFKDVPEDLESFQAAAEAVNFVYRDWKKNPEISVPGSHPEISEFELFESLGDQAYVSPAFQYLKQFLSTSLSAEQRAYLYVFDHYPLGKEGDVSGGMKHADDVAYTFGQVTSKFRDMGASQEVVTRETILGRNFRILLTNFAKSGDPHRPEPLPGWPKWPEYSSAERGYLAVSPSPRVQSAYRAEHMALWGELVPRIVTQGTAINRDMGSNTRNTGSNSCPESSSSSGAITLNGCLLWMLVMWTVFRMY